MSGLGVSVILGWGLGKSQSLGPMPAIHRGGGLEPTGRGYNGFRRSRVWLSLGEGGTRKAPASGLIPLFREGAGMKVQEELGMICDFK